MRLMSFENNMNEITKKILMVAGPDGTGETTIIRELITQESNFYEYLNADEIARGLAPLHPESVALSASKLMIRRLKELLVKEKNFAFETTASGINYQKHLLEAKVKGSSITLVFLWLSGPNQAIQRVC